MRRLYCGVLFFGLLLLSSTSSFAGFDHSSWDELLKKNVIVLEDGKATAVDYNNMLEDREQLKSYLNSLSSVTEDTFNSWEKSEQLAFLINAYNSWTVELILTKYPDLDSIKDLGFIFQSPWKKSFIPLLGKTRTLDEIEHEMIRGSGRYNNPRIHFGVNCASVGCPALRNEAYNGENLEQQLDDAERLFLSDSSRNRFNPEKGAVEISQIFKWYGEDFAKGWEGVNSLRSYLADHGEFLGMTEQQGQALVEKKIKISYLKYSWKLNGK